MLRTSDLDYDLPGELIATRPAEASAGARDLARLLVVPRTAPESLQDHFVRDLPALLNAGDLLVMNASAVLRARLIGTKVGGHISGFQPRGHVEGLYLRSMPCEEERHAARWSVLLRGSRLRPGSQIDLQSPTRQVLLRLTLLRQAGTEGHGAVPWTVELHPLPAAQALGHPSTWLESVGHPPVPSYILKRRVNATWTQAIKGSGNDQTWYQTVYASEPGSLAAPTAGLHFTPELLARLDSAGIQRTDVYLHVGLGTFQPVKSEHIQEHQMHAEWCRVPSLAAEAIERTRIRGGRVIAVGTTAARALESWAIQSPRSDAWFQTRLLIAPGHQWELVEGLLTNFHLPRSTLMALVAARLQPTAQASDESGVHRLLAAYRHAITCRYRFFSYGDAMLVLP